MGKDRGREREREGEREGDVSTYLPRQQKQKERCVPTYQGSRSRKRDVYLPIQVAEVERERMGEKQRVRKEGTSHEAVTLSLMSGIDAINFFPTDRQRRELMLNLFQKIGYPWSLFVLYWSFFKQTNLREKCPSCIRCRDRTHDLLNMSFLS